MSIYQKKNIQKLKEKSLAYYKTGLTVREVGKLVGRSSTWVHNSIHELSTEIIDKNEQGATMQV